MTEPKGIQLRWTRGWKLPEGAKSVARPHKYGNPFRVIQIVGGYGSGLAYAWEVRGPTGLVVGRHAMRPHAIAMAVDLHEENLPLLHNLRELRADLRGHDLGCYCPLDQPCHRNTLLRVANK